MSITLDTIKRIIKETESSVPVNAMGGSSSVQGSGGIDTYDPLLKKKKLRTIIKRKPLEGTTHEIITTQ